MTFLSHQFKAMRIAIGISMYLLPTFTGSVKASLYGPGGFGPFGNPQDLYQTNRRAVQDDHRKFNYDFIHTKHSAPVYFRIDKNKDNVTISGLTHVSDNIYACQLPITSWHRIEIIDHLNYTYTLYTNKNGEVTTKRHSCWSINSVDGPYALFVNAAGANRVDIEKKEDPGLIVFVNNNDSDEDGRPDNEDYYIRLGDPDLTEISVGHPYGMEIGFSYDSSIIALYENRTKRYSNRTNQNAIAFTSELRHNHYEGYDDYTLYLEGIHPGTTFLRVTGPGDYYDRLKVTVVELAPRLIPDFNHDRIINTTDENKATTNNPFRFWVNDDDDQTADTGIDAPGQSAFDALDTQIDSVRDLVDFFPVFIDLKSTLDALGTNNYTYYLQYLPGDVRFAYTDLTPANAGNYLTDLTTAEQLAATPLNTISGLGRGYPLDINFLNAIQNNGKGIILLESGVIGNAPLELIITDSSGKTITTTKLEISFSSVENMYRYLNLRPDGAGHATSTSEPANLPDALCSTKNVLFLHGFNVTTVP